MSTLSKTVKRVWAAALIITLAGCGGSFESRIFSSPTGPLAKPSNYKLKWSDEFSQSGAPSSTWAYDLRAPLLGGTVWGNNEKQFYTSNSANVSVSNGLLTIQPVAGVPQDAPSGLGLLATSARIKTDTAAYYSALNGTPYGYYEIRAKIPCIAGAWPAIWMMGRDGDWPARGEIDIMEWFGAFFTGQPNQVQSGVHTTNKFGSTALYAKQNVSGLCGDFHNHQMHWTANEIVIGVNGSPTFTYKKPSNATNADWPFDKPAHILLNVAVGGNLGGSVSTNNIPSMKMEVDYVRVWQTP